MVGASFKKFTLRENFFKPKIESLRICCTYWGSLYCMAACWPGMKTNSDPFKKREKQFHSTQFSKLILNDCNINVLKSIIFSCCELYFSFWLSYLTLKGHLKRGEEMFFICFIPNQKWTFSSLLFLVFHQGKVVKTTC